VERETLDLILNLNVRSAFLVAQAAARVMVKQGSGSIINMGSQMGHVGAKNRTVYCMTKHAIEGLTKAMAVELAVLDIRVNSVAPTFIETPLTKPMFENPEFHQDVISRIPMGHIGQVDDVANAVLFLASPAANMVTGDSLKVDGGWTAV
jgi:NAD(P)-dependent dehydrogenase (short-subunit alcohol dehydrogenase family)